MTEPASLTARQSASWLHSCAGIAVGWIVYFMFLTGTIGYVDTEIDRWMRPELPAVPVALSQQDALALASNFLQTNAGGSTRWSIYPPNGHETRQLTVSFSPRPDGDTRVADAEVALDHRTGLPISVRATGGGQALYMLHHSLRYLPASLTIWIVGVSAMAMLVAIVTGVYARRRLFRDVFSLRVFRPRRTWLDIHNFFGVLALPFHIVITYSGLVFFMFTYMSFIVSASYGGAGPQAFFDEAFQSPELPSWSGTPAPLASIGEMYRQTEAAWGESPLRLATIYNPGDANARIVFTRKHVDLTSAGARMIFDGVTGRLLMQSDSRAGAAKVNDALLAVHEGLFAGQVLRTLYLVCGALGTAMIAAGLIMWTQRRDARFPRRASGGSQLARRIDRLNAGVLVGLPSAIGIYFLANRLLPVSLAERADWELNALFIAWACLLLMPWVWPRCKIWVVQLVLGACIYALVPIVNAMSTDYGLAPAVAARAWGLVAFDATMWVIAAAFACGAYRSAKQMHR